MKEKRAWQKCMDWVKKSLTRVCHLRDLALVFFLSLSCCLPSTAAEDEQFSAGGTSSGDRIDEPSPLPMQGNASINRAGDAAVPQSSSERASERLHAVIQHTATSAWQRNFDSGCEAFAHFKFEEAEKYLMQAIRELKKTNIKDTRLIQSRNKVGDTFLAEGKYLDAQEAFEAARETEKELSLTQTPDGAHTTDGLATVYKETEKFAKAEQLFKEALQTQESTLGANDPAVASTLMDLGDLYRDQKLYKEAEPVYRLAIETYNKAANVPDLKIANALDHVGAMFYEQGMLEQANQLYAAALDIKDKHSVLYTPTSANNYGLVYYRCLNGVPNSYHAFTRGVEAEFINVKNVSAVATLTAKVFASDWWTLKAQVTIHNNGKTAISAMTKSPVLRVDSPKRVTYMPLDSDAIAAELDLRGSILADRILHSADFDYIVDSVTTPGVAVVPTVGGGAFLAAVPGFAHISPNWQARIDARNAAISTFARSQAAADTIASCKPAHTTIGPGESATFLIYFYYAKFRNARLQLIIGNTVLEFPFTEKSG